MKGAIMKFRIPFLILCCIFLLSLAGCATGIGHSQGEITGEVTTDSAIFQSRLTAICKTRDCGLRGTRGVARFEISTDPEGLIDQPYTDQTITGGFLKVTVRPGEGGVPETCEFSFYDENGVMLYTTTRSANQHCPMSSHSEYDIN